MTNIKLPPNVVDCLSKLDKSSNGEYLLTNQDVVKIVLSTIKSCVEEIHNYQVPVGNSSAGEMACEWTLDALRDVRQAIYDKHGIK